MSAATEPAVTLASLLAAFAALSDDTAEWADDQLAGGKPATWILHRLIDANRSIASAARGEPVTP